MIHIKGAEGLKGKIKIVYNPLSELALALDLLSHPQHHKLHLNWVNAILDRFSQKEKEQLDFYKYLLDGYLNLDLHIDFLNYPFDQTLQSSTCSEYLCFRNNWISTLNTETMEQLTFYLGFVWESYIYPVVEEHYSAIKEQERSGNTILNEKGLQFLFRKVNDRISFTANNSMEIEKWIESTFESSDMHSFYLELSLFAFPHLVVSDRHNEGSFWLSWDVPFRDDKIIAPGIDRISLKAFALSDKSRLRILLMLSEEPMTQKELTRHMGFAKSTISRHINILLDAGLIRSEDGGRNVLLKLDVSSLDVFSREIMSWVGKIEGR
jgi:DNA-binding transcriptional ArsR family regulator